MTSAVLTRQRAFLVALLVVATVQWAYVVTGDVGVPRLVVAVAFVLLVPGHAVVGLLPPPEASSRLTLSIAVGLALTTLVVQVLVWSGRYSMVLALGILTLVSVPGLLLQYRRAGRADSTVDLIGPS